MSAYTYMNYAGLAPLRLGSIPAGLLPVELLGNALLPAFFRLQEDTRRRAAQWLNVEARQVAFLSSTTTALQTVAATLDWRAGDVVLYPRKDFPANVLPWQDLARFGVEACPVEDWDAPWPMRTRLVTALEPWSGIVSVDPSPHSAAQVVRSGYRRRIVSAERGPYVRLSAHCFTPTSDLDRTLNWLWDELHT